MVRARYLEKEWTLVLSLRTGWPEPVGKWAGFSRGDKVAESQRLLQEIRNLFMRLHTVRTLALQQGRNSRFTSFHVSYHMLRCMSLDILYNYTVWRCYILTHRTTYRGMGYMRRDINPRLLSISQPPSVRNSIQCTCCLTLLPSPPWW